MSKIGFFGLGKLGLPVALAVEDKGHEVRGYDISPSVVENIENRTWPHAEDGLQELLNKTKLELTYPENLVEWSDIIFVPIQTPHDSRYEGTTRLPSDRKDFDYTYLLNGIKAIADICAKLGEKRTVAVISTCLPGTFNEQIKDVLNDYIDYVYTPQFIAMGTVIDDYLNPEFNLIGVDSQPAAEKLSEFYATINQAPNIVTDITTAEGIKVSYNTWITMKTVVSNLWGELSEKLGMNFSDIYRAWSVSSKRLLSPRYMQSGMGDGGGCHPRDNIALSFVAAKCGLSHNIFEDLMLAREDTEDWHARVAIEHANRYDLPLIVLGRSFKPETNIETGSPALLMAAILDDYGMAFDHVEHMTDLSRAVYFLGTQNAEYAGYDFPAGSVVIDPFGYIEDMPEVTVVRLGRK